MKKIYSLLLLATLLLISGEMWADNVAKIGTTEYATFAEAVAAASGNADADNVIELMADVNVADIAVSGKAVILKHKIGSVEHITGSVIGGVELAQTINSECILRRGDWKNAVIVGDLEKCVELNETPSNITTMASDGRSGGYDTYFIGKSITLTKDMILPQKPFDRYLVFCGKPGNPLTLDMAGHKIEQTVANNGSDDPNNFGCIQVKSGILNITGNGKIYGSYHGLNIDQDATVNFYNGIIASKGYYNNSWLGGYHVNMYGTFNMYGGTIGTNTEVDPDVVLPADHRIYCAVLVYMCDDPTKIGDKNRPYYDGIINIYGGRILSVSDYGYLGSYDISMYVYDWDGTHKTMSTMSGGVIEGNVYAYGALNMTGGEIQKGLDYGAYTATISGGKIGWLTIYDDYAPIITGGRFDDNEVWNYKDYNATTGQYTSYETPVLDDIVMSGYVVNTLDEDNYKYEVVLAGAKESVESEMTDGSRLEWNVAWGTDGGGDAIIPTATTETTVNTNHHVYVEDGNVATAYSVDINSNTTLTVEAGGTLVVGAGGISGATEDNFIVEDGAYVVISPAIAEARPTGTVKYIAKYAGKKNGVSTVSGSNDLYWEQMAIPTLGKPESFTGVPSYFNTWDITNAWQTTNREHVDTPFKGYFISNETTYSAAEKNTEYVFTGELVGNQVNILNFAREGFTFFGNSYTAPIGIFELLSELNVDNVEATVYVYRPLEETYWTINMATAGRRGRPSQIEPMQGFFIYAADKTHVNASYMNTVWNALMATSAAPARARKHFAAEAVLTLTSANGLSDELVVLENADFSVNFDQNYDARKMMNNSGMNVYVPGETNLAVIATDNLEGTPIAVQTTSETQYTFNFTDVEGNLALYDAVSGTTISMTDGANYTFTAQANSTIVGRFSIISSPRVVTGIENIDVQNSIKGVYTASGMYIGESVNWNELPMGVYVVNGQKVVK